MRCNRCAYTNSLCMTHYWCLVCTFLPVGSVGFLPDFAFYMAVLGAGRGPIGLVAPLRFKILDSQPDSSNMGPVSIDFHDFVTFSGKVSWLPDTVFIGFSAQPSQSRLFMFFDRDQKDAREKVTQIRGGIISRSALFACFVPI